MTSRKTSPVGLVLGVAGEAVVLLIAWYLISWWRWEQTLDIRYVVPTGYRGLVIFQINDAAGERLPRDHDQLVVRVPNSGVFFAKDDLGIHQWHRLTVEYADGRVIPQEPSSPDSVYYECGAAAGNRLLLLVVGSRRDHLNYDPSGMRDISRWLVEGIPRDLEAPHYENAAPTGK